MFEELGEWDDVVLLAQKKIIAEKIRRAMAKQRMTKAALANRMGTSRSQVEAILDPNESGLTLQSLSRAAFALGLEPSITFRTAQPASVRRGSRRSRAA
jgi:transcriptional regulator with XRE-family HTH domain